MPPPEPSSELARMEARYQDMVAKYYHVQAAFQAAQHESQRLAALLQAKQEAIVLLLPHHPYPLTPELQDLLNAA